MDLNENLDFILVEDEDEIPAQFGQLALVEPTTYNFHGIDIHFPFPAYPCQQELAEAIIASLNSHSNCLLESATGSGKTLAFLCPLLAWQKNQEEQNQVNQPDLKNFPEYDGEDPPKVSKIYYATRTLGHIEQIVSQLHLTAYANTPMGILANREKTCTKQQPFDPDEENYDPREVPIFARADNHFCRYRPNSFGWAQHINSQDNKSWNIQELKAFCTKRDTCPYFELLNAKREAKIIFCTFNYLLHSGIRQAMGIDLRNNVLVFDEGHDVEEMSRQIASTSQGLLSLPNISNLTKVLLESLSSPGVPLVKRQPLRNLFEAFNNFKSLLQSYLARRIQTNTVLLSFQQTLKMLDSCGLGPNNIFQLWADYLILEDRPPVASLIPEVAVWKVERRTMRSISTILFVLDLFYDGHPHFENQGGYHPRLDYYSNTNVELRLICLNPAVCFRDLNTARSVIITSGTLSAMERTSLELGIPFETQLSATFAIPTQRIFTAIVDRYDDGAKPLYLTRAGWDLNFNNYQNQVARIIRDICAVVPHGILVLFTTKGLIQDLLRVWQRNGHLVRIAGLKQVCVEPERSDPEALNAILSTYRKNLGNGKGSILFAVMRGKLAERVGFRDNQARALVTVGIPFMHKEDAFVRAKLEHEDGRLDLEGNENGRQWHSRNAFQALNQALGRSLRHLNGWSSIFLVDTRLSDPDHRSKLPTWVRESSARNLNGNGTPKPFTELLQGLSDLVVDLNQ